MGEGESEVDSKGEGDALGKGEGGFGARKMRRIDHFPLKSESHLAHLLRGSEGLEQALGSGDAGFAWGASGIDDGDLVGMEGHFSPEAHGGGLGALGREAFPVAYLGVDPIDGQAARRGGGKQGHEAAMGKDRPVVPGPIPRTTGAKHG